jgi:hypothetical protein
VRAQISFALKIAFSGQFGGLSLRRVMALTSRGRPI